MGSGPVLLLLHGIGDHSASWVPLMPQLAERFTVIAPDLLGHGQSDKPRADYSVAAYANGMRDLLDILEVEHATIVGHSLGGGVAAQLAYQYPNKCERLVLVGTGGVGREVNPALRIASAPFAEILLPPLAWPIGRITTRLAVNVLALLGSDIGRDARRDRSCARFHAGRSRPVLLLPHAAVRRRLAGPGRHDAGPELPGGAGPDLPGVG